MDLDELFSQWQGQTIPASLVGDSDASDNGQCFIWFDLVLNKVYGQPFFHASGAIDIWETPGVLKNSFTLIPYSPNMSVPKGAIVVYGTGVGSQFGHVSVAAENGIGSDYVGYDSNWGDSKKLEQITHNDKFNATILGILVFEEEDVKPTSDEVAAFYQAVAGRQPTESELETAVGLQWPDWIKFMEPGIAQTRQQVTNLETERDSTLYPFVNAVCADLNIPITTDLPTVAKAITALQSSGEILNATNVQNYIKAHLT